MKPWTAKTIIAAMLFSLILLFGYFVWPTPYRYDHWGEVLVRIDRRHGTAERLTAYGWRRMEPPASVPAGFIPVQEK